MSALADTFPRTGRALATDRHRATLAAAALVAACLALLAAFLLAARVPLHAVSRSARLEAATESRGIAAGVAGIVSEAPGPGPGRPLAAGDAILVLDDRAERIAREAAAARHEALVAETASLRSRLRSATAAIAPRREAFEAGIAGAAARADEAAEQARLLAEIAERISTLRRAGSASEVDELRARSDVVRTEAAALAARHALSGLTREAEAAAESGEAEIEGLRADLARVEGEAAALAAEVRRLDHEIARRTVRAPVPGIVVDAPRLLPGSRVEEGTIVATLLPDGPIRAVAEFSPADGIGRVRTGQRARVRLDGFPASEFGVIEARVTSVALEAREGGVRAEISFEEAPPSGLPSRHGMPATIEVEVDRVSPISLLLGALAGGSQAR